MNILKIFWFTSNSVTKEIFVIDYEYDSALIKAIFLLKSAVIFNNDFDVKFPNAYFSFNKFIVKEKCPGYFNVTDFRTTDFNSILAAPFVINRAAKIKRLL